MVSSRWKQGGITVVSKAESDGFALIEVFDIHHELDAYALSEVERLLRATVELAKYHIPGASVSYGGFGGREPWIGPIDPDLAALAVRRVVKCVRHHAKHDSRRP